MSFVDEILGKKKLAYDDLSKEERETLMMWSQALQNNELTLEKVKGHVASIRDAISGEISRFDNSKEQDLFLKARLKNIILIEALLSSPERAKKAIEQALAGISGR